MIQPIKAEYLVGTDVHGRALTLELHRNHEGRMSWWLKRAGGEGVHDRMEMVTGLSAENFARIAAIAGEVEGAAR